MPSDVATFEVFDFGLLQPATPRRAMAASAMFIL
jgi:hypothetical protein